MAHDHDRATASRLPAIEDAFHGFDADHILVSTHPAARSSWQERHVVERARARCAAPLAHVVVDVGLPPLCDAAAAGAAVAT